MAGFGLYRVQMALRNVEGERGTSQPILKEENAGSSCRMDQSRKWRLVTKGCHTGNRKGWLKKQGRTRVKRSRHSSWA